MALGKRVTRSRLGRAVLVWLYACFASFVFATTRWRIHGREDAEALIGAGQPFICAFWHGRLMLAPHGWPRGTPIHVMISRHRDGENIARATRHLGVVPIRGSRTRGGVAAGRAALRVLKEGGYVAISPDGPRGPRMRVQPGIIALPAGPLREPLACGLGQAHALVLIGVDQEGALATLGPHDLPVIEASLVPGDEVGALRERPVVVFAGIGRPEKFFETLVASGCNVIVRHAFADHHRYKPGEIAAIVDYAKERDAVTVTTEKDHVRLPPDTRAMVHTLPVTLTWRNPSEPRDLLAPFVERCRSG